jgi:hypothetical protein
MPTARGRQTRADTDCPARVARTRGACLTPVDDDAAECRSDMRELLLCRGGAVDG